MGGSDGSGTLTHSGGEMIGRTNVDDRRSAIGLLVLGLVAASGACGGDDGSERFSQAREAAGDFARAADAMKESAEEMAEAAREGVTVEPVDFRRLRDLLPESVAGMARENAGGETSGAMGMRISKAEATYRYDETVGSGDRRRPGSIGITITDAGALGGLGTMGIAAWAAVEIDRESDRGYERTTEHGGHPAHEKFERTGEGELGRGEMQVMVAKRFIVEVRGSRVTMEQVKDAMGSIDLDALVEMKDEGVSTG